MTAPDKAFEEWVRAWDLLGYRGAFQDCWLASRKAALEEAANICDFEHGVIRDAIVQHHLCNEDDAAGKLRSGMVIAHRLHENILALLHSGQSGKD